MAIAIAAAFFFIVWGVLNDYGAETPWVTAGVGSSIVLAGAVVVREIVVRRGRRRGKSSANARVQADVGGKLTVDLNARILKEIKRRSDAANVLSRLPEAHREVFEFCAEYVSRIDEELKTINAVSPRLEPILRGRKKAAKIHRFHMLRWAEIEATELTLKAQNDANLKDRLVDADNALGTIETALQAYPAERALLESHAVLNEMVVSMHVSQCLSEAELAVASGEYSQAKSLYRDALLHLGRDNVSSTQRADAAVHINAEIEKIRQYEQNQG